MTLKGTTMQKINRTALRVALTSKLTIGIALFALLIIGTMSFLGTHPLAIGIWTGVYSAILLAGLGIDYTLETDRQQSRADHEAHLARIKADRDRWQAEHDEAAERRDIERDIERADHEARLVEITRTGADPGPSDAVLAIQQRRQAEREAADEEYRIERAARQARISRRQKQSTS